MMKKKVMIFVLAVFFVSVVSAWDSAGDPYVGQAYWCTQYGVAGPNPLGYGYIVFNWGTTITWNDHCPNGDGTNIIREHWCQPFRGPTAQNFYCPYGRVCSSALGICVVCTNDGHCGANQKCQNYVCVDKPDLCAGKTCPNICSGDKKIRFYNGYCDQSDGLCGYNGAENCDAHGKICDEGTKTCISCGMLNQPCCSGGNCFWGECNANSVCVQVQNNWCTDPDGENLYVKTKSSSDDYPSGIWDVCLNSQTIRELVCVGGSTGELLYQNYNCPSGTQCNDGKCVSQVPYCGDGNCNGGETCSSCPSDCGACPVSECSGYPACVNDCILSGGKWAYRVFARNPPSCNCLPISSTYCDGSCDAVTGCSAGDCGTCESLGIECGSGWDDGCGGSLDCGECSGEEHCSSQGRCVVDCEISSLEWQNQEGEEIEAVVEGEEIYAAVVGSEGCAGQNLDFLEIWEDKTFWGLFQNDERILEAEEQIFDDENKIEFSWNAILNEQGTKTYYYFLTSMDDVDVKSDSLEVEGCERKYPDDGGFRNVERCSDYDKFEENPEAKCKADCNYAANQEIMRLGVSDYFDVKCVWINNHCKLSYTTSDAKSSCIFSSTDVTTCENSEFKTVRYSVEERDENGFPVANSPNCDISNYVSGCLAGGSSCEVQILCPARIMLPFFGLMNFLVSVFLVGLVYLFLSRIYLRF